MTDLLALVREHVADLDWQSTLVVRDAVTSELDAAVNRKQAEDPPAVESAPVPPRPAARTPRLVVADGVNLTGTADVATGHDRKEGGERVDSSRTDPPAPQPGPRSVGMRLREPGSPRGDDAA